MLGELYFCIFAYKIKITMKEKRHSMGVLKEDFCNYCLMASSGFIILTKQMRLEDEIEFDKEVSNLVKYFNAEVIIEDFIDRRKFPNRSEFEFEVSYKNPTKIEKGAVIINYPFNETRRLTPEEQEALDKAYQDSLKDNTALKIRK